MPHISLAYTDVTPQTLSCRMEHLAFQPINFEMWVNNLALIFEPDGKIGTLRYRFEFEGEEK